LERPRHGPRWAGGPARAQAEGGRAGLPDGHDPAALRRLLAGDPLPHRARGHGAYADDPGGREGPHGRGRRDDRPPRHHPPGDLALEPRRWSRDPARPAARSGASARA
jgi:hypothetical protein